MKVKNLIYKVTQAPAGMSCVLLRQMKKSLAPGLVMLGLMAASADTFLFDVGQNSRLTTQGAAPNDSVRFWNNINETIGTSDIGLLPSALSTNGSPSYMQWAMVRRFNGPNANGTSSSTLYPANATADNLYGNTGSFLGRVNVFPSFKLKQLDPNTLYRFTFYGSRASLGASENRETLYVVEGANSSIETNALNVANNIDNVVVSSQFSPNSAGEITISMYPGPNNNNSVKFTHLNVLQVDTTLPPPTPVVFALEPTNQTVFFSKDATFTAAVTGSGPFTVRWYQNDIEVASQTTYYTNFSYTVVGAFLDNSRISVSVSNAVYGARSRDAVLRVELDQTPPQLASITSPSGLNALLVFSEEMDTNTTAVADNYLINGTPATAAVPSADKKSVTLTFPNQVAGVYTVKVSGVTDWFSNPIEPGLTINGTVTGPLPAQCYLVDFGAASIATLNNFQPGDDSTNYWNNVTVPIGTVPGSVLPLKTSYRNDFGAALVIVNRFNNVNSSGTTVCPFFAANATQDNLFGNKEVWDTLTDVVPTFKVTGLDPVKFYTFTFFGSRSATDNREAIYTVEGANTNAAALNAASNVDKLAVVAGMQPTTAGEVTISMAPGQNNNNANHFTHLSVLKIIESAPEFLAPIRNGSQIQLHWIGQGQLEWAPSLSGPWTPTLPAPVSGHSEPLATEGGRFFRLKK